MFVDKCLGSSIREEISSRTRAALSMEGFPKSSLVPVGQEAGRPYRGRGVGWGLLGGGPGTFILQVRLKGEAGTI